MYIMRETRISYTLIDQEKMSITLGIGRCLAPLWKARKHLVDRRNVPFRWNRMEFMRSLDSDLKKLLA